MVLNTLVYIALVIIVIIVIVILLRFLFNVLFVMPVTLEHDYIIKYAGSIYLPSV
jgi:hypothetical protein